jgi:tRNA(Ile)-lysidine synthase
VGSKKILVGISGGIDSVVLLHLLSSCGYSARAVYIHHGTRPGQDSELEFVKKYASQLGVKFLSMKITDLDPNKNFEFNARLKRYDLFHKTKKDDEVISLAHHIDDSLEWTFLQGLKSSNLKSTIGIPVINGTIIRPLMCMTKAQIKSYAKCFDLPHIDDPTNESLKYERNFLRHEVVPSFANRHPQYLKHYVNRHNELARVMGIHAQKNIKCSFKLLKKENSVILYSLNSQIDFSGFEALVVLAMQYLNPNDRGTLHGQIEKIQQALMNNKFGPLSLTKGIKAYISLNSILICNNKFKPNYPNNISNKELFETISFDDFLIKLKNTISDETVFPLWILLDKKSRWLNVNKREYPLCIDYTRKLNAKSLCYLSGLSLLAQWSKEKNRSKKISLRFLVN